MIKNVYVEEPIFLEDLKVRGFADLIIELDDGRVYLYDIKTIINPKTYIWNMINRNRKY